MRFDSNRAWLDASALVSANRDVVLAIAGVFLVLPSFALSILAPQPQPGAGSTPEAYQAQVLAYFSGNWPLLVATMLAFLLGALALLALFADRARPTVAEALQQGARGMIPAFIAILGVIIVTSLLVSLPVALAQATGTTLLAEIVRIAAIVALWAALVRAFIALPVIVLERTGNPVKALRRAWQLSRGQVSRLLFFFLLLMIATFVIVQVGGGLADLGLRLVLGGELGVALGALVAAVLSALTNTYLVAVLAATHRQLSGADQPAPVIPIE